MRIPLDVLLDFYELHDKALKVVKSCITFNQLDAAKKYCKLTLDKLPEAHGDYYLDKYFQAIKKQTEIILTYKSKLN